MKRESAQGICLHIVLSHIIFYNLFVFPILGTCYSAAGKDDKNLFDFTNSCFQMFCKALQSPTVVLTCYTSRAARKDHSSADFEVLARLPASMSHYFASQALFYFIYFSTVLHGFGRLAVHKLDKKLATEQYL